MTETSFEKAFERLEEILHKMNESEVSLDTSLKLFEEANTLIQKCSEKLVNAEQKIEILIKNRNAEIELDKDRPKTRLFDTEKENILE
jgi:exodeoxyribonuclease VII small subunit